MPVKSMYHDFYLEHSLYFLGFMKDSKTVKQGDSTAARGE